MFGSAVQARHGVHYISGHILLRMCPFCISGDKMAIDKSKVKYYCEKCAKKNNWEWGGFVMDTRCSVCNKTKECMAGPPWPLN